MRRPDLACVGELMVDVHVGVPMPPPGGRAHGRITLLPGGSAVTAALATSARPAGRQSSQRTSNHPRGRTGGNRVVQW